MLAYIDMKPENGGIVLDVSEGGLGFHSVAPVEQARPIRFWFSLEAGDQIEATGELAWTDKTRKVGGLRLTYLPEERRKQIRTWVVRSTTPGTPGTNLPPLVAAPNESSGFRTGEHFEDLAPVFKAVRSRARAATLVPSQLGLTPDQEPIWDPIPVAQSGPVSRPQFIRGVITGIFVMLVLTTAFLVHTHRREVGDSLIRLAKRIAPETRLQMGSPAPAAIATSNPPPADAKPVEKATEAASTEATLNNVAPAPAGPRPRTSQSASGGESELTVAQQYLRGTKGRRDTSVGARWLWAAIRNGNTTAEVLLADLYLRGDGVTKNCDQARVLLIVASRKGNIQAMEKLRELNRKGCP